MRSQNDRLEFAIILSLLLHALIIGLLLLGSLFTNITLPEAAGGNDGSDEEFEAVMVDTGQVAAEYGRLQSDRKGNSEPKPVEDTKPIEDVKEETAEEVEKVQEKNELAVQQEREKVLEEQRKALQLAQQKQQELQRQEELKQEQQRKLEQQRQEQLEKQKEEEATRKKAAEAVRLEAEAEAKRLEAAAKQAEEERKEKEALQKAEQQKKLEQQKAQEAKEKAAAESKAKAEKEAKEKAAAEAQVKAEKEAKAAAARAKNNKALDDFLSGGEIGGDSATKGGNKNSSGLAGNGNGRAVGDGQGTADRGYERLIKQKLSREYQVDPSFSGLECRIKINIERDGRISSHQVISGPPDICRAAVAAITRAQNVPRAKDDVTYNTYKSPIIKFGLKVL